MPRVDRDAFGERKLVRVYIAMKLAEARDVEQVLTAGEFEYAVLVEPIGRTLFGFARNAAVFCVPREHGEQCTEVLTRAGFRIGVVPQDPDDEDEDQAGHPD